MTEFMKWTFKKYKNNKSLFVFESILNLGSHDFSTVAQERNFSFSNLTCSLYFCLRVLGSVLPS